MRKRSMEGGQEKHHVSCSGHLVFCYSKATLFILNEILNYSGAQEQLPNRSHSQGASLMGCPRGPVQNRKI